VPRIRQHVNPLKSDLLEIADVPRVTAAPGPALDVELGAAEAHFLIDLARADDKTLFVGVEIRRELVTFTNGELVEGRSSRTCAGLRQHVRRHATPLRSRQRAPLLPELPDPWFKTRQHKRRVIGPELMQEIPPRPRPSGELFVQTDIFDLALEAMAAAESGTPALFENTSRSLELPPRQPVPAQVPAASASARAREPGSGACSTGAPERAAGARRSR
jgi:tRNA (guanine-N7-)-methyltransferase